jgi:hypothetical protein
MFLASYEPGQEMAIANFFLAIFCLFTITLPLLLITRGDKTESNRDFVAATINPWSQIGKEIKLTPVVISAINPTIEIQPKPEFIYENKDRSIAEIEGTISIENKSSENSEKLLTEVFEPNDEVIAA